MSVSFLFLCFCVGVVGLFWDGGFCVSCVGMLVCCWVFGGGFYFLF